MTKLCNSCFTEQPKTNFSKRLASKDGHQNKCKSCTSLLAKKRDYKKLYNTYNKEYAIKVKYNLTLEQYENLILKGCSICGSHTKIVLDHCHNSDIIRGPLCHKCNTGIGLFEDDINRLESAINYLKEHSKND